MLVFNMSRKKIYNDTSPTNGPLRIGGDRSLFCPGPYPLQTSSRCGEAGGPTACRPHAYGTRRRLQALLGRAVWLELVVDDDVSRYIFPTYSKY